MLWPSPVSPTRAWGRAALITGWCSFPKLYQANQVRLRLVHVKGAPGLWRSFCALWSRRLSGAPPAVPMLSSVAAASCSTWITPAQLRWKRQQVVDALERLGWSGGGGACPPWAWRTRTTTANKAQLPLGRQGGQLVMGFFQRGSHDIVESTHL